MKRIGGIVGIVALGIAALVTVGCTRMSYASQTRIDAERRAAIAEAEAQRLRYELEGGGYQDLLVDDYESAYERRLRGFDSPIYDLPISYYSFRWGPAYSSAVMWDPNEYNVMVVGDQVWVEPKYITSLFGSWGRPSVDIYFRWNTSPYSLGWASNYYGTWYDYYMEGMVLTYLDPYWHGGWYWNSLPGYGYGSGYRHGYYDGYYSHYNSRPGYHAHFRPDRPTFSNGYRGDRYRNPISVTASGSSRPSSRPGSYGSRGSSYGSSTSRVGSYGTSRGTTYSSGTGSSRGSSYSGSSGSSRGSTYSSGSGSGSSRGSSYSSGSGSSRGSSYSSGSGSGTSSRGSSYSSGSSSGSSRGSSYSSGSSSSRGSSYSSGSSSSRSSSSGSSSRSSSSSSRSSSSSSSRSSGSSRGGR